MTPTCTFTAMKPSGPLSREASRPAGLVASTPPEQAPRPSGPRTCRAREFTASMRAGRRFPPDPLRSPTPCNTQAAAHRIIDWGADLVVGNHPHVLQGMEVYNGKMICYSLGNFCFGGNKNPADKNTAIYQQAFTLINGELQPGIDAQIISCTLSSVSSYNDFRPTVASGEKAQEICNLMNTYSQNCSNIEIDELGNLHVN